MDKLLHIAVSAVMVVGFHCFGWNTSQAIFSSLAVGASREITQAQGAEGWRDMGANTIGAGLGALIVHSNRDTRYEDAIKAGAHRIPLTATQLAQFDSAAACLHLPDGPVPDSTTRILVGTRLPSSWDAPPGHYLGYAAVGINTILLAPRSRDDTTVLNHEFVHLRLNRGGHPQAYFSGTCGVLAGPKP